MKRAQLLPAACALAIGLLAGCGGQTRSNPTVEIGRGLKAATWEIDTDPITADGSSGSGHYNLCVSNMPAIGNGLTARRAYTGPWCARTTVVLHTPRQNMNNVEYATMAWSVYVPHSNYQDTVYQLSQSSAPWTVNNGSTPGSTQLDFTATDPENYSYHFTCDPNPIPSPYNDYWYNTNCSLFESSPGGLGSFTLGSASNSGSSDVTMNFSW